MFSNTSPRLATRFARNTHVDPQRAALAEDQMRAAAPSIFAAGKHDSRSQRYTYIPTIDVLRGLRKEGFEPFMIAQSKSRIEGKSEFTKHMIRMRHAGMVNHGEWARAQANEIILINSHDGASSYQMLAGVFRFVCCNGMVVGDVANDIRIPHKGHIQDEVIDGAFRVLDDFEAVDASVDGMKSSSLMADEEHAFATAALALRYGERTEGEPPAPITSEQLLELRRPEDVGHTVWATFQRVQENMLRGGQRGRSAQGRRVETRPVGSIDRSVSLNRALWVLAGGDAQASVDRLSNVKTRVESRPGFSTQAHRYGVDDVRCGRLRRSRAELPGCAASPGPTTRPTTSRVGHEMPYSAAR